MSDIFKSHLRFIGGNGLNDAKIAKVGDVVNVEYIKDFYSSYIDGLNYNISSTKERILKDVFKQIYGNGPTIEDAPRFCLVTGTGLPPFTELLQIDGIIVGKIVVTFKGNGGSIEFVPVLERFNFGEIKAVFNDNV